MKPRIVSTALLSLTLFFVSPLSATQTVGDIQEWTPPRLNHKAPNILEFVMSERPTVIQKNQEDTNNDYGFSFPGVTPIHKLCLTEICQRYTANGVRPRVLDLGAGHGFMTWKMLVAGGYVIALEKQRPTLEALKTRVKEQVIPFLAPEEKFAQITAACLGNVLDFDNCLAYKQKRYDVTWSGNIIHQLKRGDAVDYVQNLFKITNSSGYAFATVNAPSGNGNNRMIERFLEEQEAGNQFPGSLVINKLNYRTENHLTGQKTGRNVNGRFVDFVGPFPVAPENMDIVKANEGFYGEGTENSVIDQVFDGYVEHYTYKSHTATHLFDTKSLSSLFADAGFMDIEVFFINKRGERYDGELSVELMSQGVYSVGIKARRP